MQSSWGNRHLHCSWMVRCCKISVYQSAKLRGLLIGTEGVSEGVRGGETPDGYGALKGVFCGFWAHGFYIFLKVHKIFHRLIYNMAISVISHFSPYGEPTGEGGGGFFAPREGRGYAQLCFDCIPYFFDCLDVMNIWAKFSVFITIRKILTISCASGLD